MDGKQDTASRDASAAIAPAGRLADMARTVMPPAIAVAVFVILLIGAIWAGYGLAIEQQRAVALAAAREETANLARAFEEHTRLILRSASVATRLAKRVAERPAGHDLAGEISAIDWERTDEITILSVADADGNQIASSVGATGINFSDRSHFQAHLERDTGRLAFGVPTLGRTTGKWTMHVTRRINRPDGSFGGIASAGVDLAGFDRFFREINLGQGGVIMLLGRDGIVRARSDATGVSAVQDVRGKSDALERVERGEQHGSLLGASPLDGVRRVTSFRAVAEYPLVVVVAKSEREALAGFEAVRRQYAAGAAAFTALVLLLAATVWLMGLRQQHANAALRRSEARFRAVFENAALGIVTTDADGRYLLVNDTFCRMLGYAREELVGRPARDFHHPEDRELGEDERKRLWEGEIDSFTLERRYVRRDGTDIWTRRTASAVRDAAGKPLYLIRVIEDITAAQRMEQGLRESEERYRMLFEESPLPMWVRDEESLRILAVNQAAVEHYGYSREEFLALSAKELWAAEDRTEYERYWSERAPGLTMRATRRQRCKDGRVIEVEITSRACAFAGRNARLSLIQDVTEKARAQRRLAASEARFRAIYEHAGVGITLRSAHARNVTWLQVNNRFCEMIGYKREELALLSTEDITYPDGQQAAIADNERVRRGEVSSYVREKRLMRKDGSELWVALSVAGLPDEDGAFGHLISIYQDITERKSAEAALRASEERLRTITDNVPALICYVDASERYRFVNRTVEDWHGVPVSEYIGRPMKDMIGEAAYAVNKPDLDDVLAGNVVTRERRVRGERERYAHLTYLPHRAEDGGVLGFYLLGYDVTERRKAEEALAREHMLLRTVIDALPDSIYVKDREIRYLLANKAWFAHMGLPETETIEGRVARDFFPEEMAQALDAEDRAVVTSGRALKNHERQIRDLMGRNRWLVADKVPLWDEGRSNIVGTVALTRDVTEVREAQEQIRILNADLERRVSERTAELEAVNQELEAFASSVSHDLRAPLRSIDGFSQVLLEEYRERLDASGTDCLRRVRAASQRMAALIDDLLALSRIARSQMQFLPVDLSEIARQIVEELQQEERGRTVKTQIAPGLRVRGDPSLLRIMLDNLLRNAWKFTRHRNDARIEVGVERDEEHHVYYVRDNGVGFDMAYAGKLFGAFQRLHTEREFPGTGIGLAIVQRVMRRHGGEVWAEARVNDGAVFYFTLAAPSGRTREQPVAA